MNETYLLSPSLGPPEEKLTSWPSTGEAYLATDNQVAAVATLPNGFSHATRDLTRAIANKTFPAWTLYVQTMELDANITLAYDPLDATKIWPEELFPLREVGRIVLNENIGDQFLENEQLAFSPSMVVPGEGRVGKNKACKGHIMYLCYCPEKQIDVILQFVPNFRYLSQCRQAVAEPTILLSRCAWTSETL